MTDSLGRLALALTRWSERWIPSSFVIAVLLTAVTFALSLALTSTSLLDAIGYWGDGFWELLSFSMQMSLIMVSGYMVAVSAPVDRFLTRLARIPRSPRGAVAFMACFSMGLGLLHWGLSIVGSAVLLKRLARRQPGVDYRLLVTAGYLGMGLTWHAGLSASAPLLVATPGHFLEAQMGVLPLSQTIFSAFNLLLAGVVLVVFGTLVPALHPKPAHALTVDPRILAEEKGEEGAADATASSNDPDRSPSRRSFAEWIDHSPALGWIVGALGLIWLTRYFGAKGWTAITLNVVNFTYLMLAITLHGRGSKIVAAAEGGVRLTSGVILQFPFYAGMYGIIKGSGLVDVLGDAFVRVATPESYPLLVYWYSGIVNYFVPSGGSKWAIEAPYILQAGQTLGVEHAKTVMAYAWGDMLTDIIQPFWALPLLRAARLDFRHILGYCMLVFVLYATLVSGAFWLLGR